MGYPVWSAGNWPKDSNWHHSSAKLCRLLTLSIIQILSILNQSSGTGRFYLLCTEYLPSFILAATKKLFFFFFFFYNHPFWQCWSKAAASHEHQTPLTHIAFQKIYLEPCTTATRGKGKRSKMDTIIADIKAVGLNTWVHRWSVHMWSPFT